MLASNNKILIALSAVIATACGWYFFSNEKKVDFNTEVKPILNKKCISCHGGVKQSGGFSVLFREEALAKTESGKPAIVPGKPDESEFIRRLTLNDPEERMPYKHDPLPKEEIKILKAWVKQGAEWGKHWAYIPVMKESIPDENDDWIQNDIDRFIFEKLEAEELSPSAPADKATILRRISLDLTGLPPSPEIAKQFLSDPSEKAYEQLVDALLASPRYGERWTSLWLDLARYADTKGYEKDAHRSIWRYRDWLIKAFNENKPYDQFLIEQIAGDLLPNATDEQYIATAFQRNTLTNDEGGTDNEEYRTAAVLDRVNTTWEALMGTTFACVQCHSHPYDPFKHEDYYRFMAFFNNTRDEDTFEDFPLLREYRNADSAKFESLKLWLSQNATPASYNNIIRFLKTGQPVINSVVTDQMTNSALADTKWLSLRNNASCRIKKVNLNDKAELMFRYATGNEGGVWKLHLDSAGGPLLATATLKPTKGWEIATIDITPTGGVHDIWLSYYNPKLQSANDNGAMFSWFYFKEPFPARQQPGFDTAFKYYNDLAASGDYIATPILVENPADLFRTTNIFERGSWLSKGDAVQPGVPSVLNKMPEGAPKNRLGLAMWLTDKQNPLTARTMVNRLWEQLFGFGIVETLEDMGTQGMAPTHKALLDHLSWRFMNDYKWDVKALLKEMVMSATYRQRSEVSDALLKKDPGNKFYARGPRVRLSAEQIRDQTLAVSHVLSTEMYGKSVMPYQPEGIWNSPYNGAEWKLSEGDDQYRRAVYTYWKRTAPYPSMIGFDAAMRDVCLPRRIRTNTPLQALSTLNDFAFWDMARHFADHINKTAGGDIRKQISEGYEAMLYKPIPASKLNKLVELYNESVKSLASGASDAKKILGPEQKPDIKKAAMVVVANAMLNLDEWLNKS
ncbi:DUF1553 domain-containing protein [Niabella insulamsoli]|uniref:DUF1553 domain-containing protein n=1 Tax=Niabella insulamsoli TaxID=3144874 RepID=UPI0031FBAF25